MVKSIKYTAEVEAPVEAACGERLPGCEEKATVHVCFEDGGGAFVCDRCLNARLNRGDWITDACQVLLAS